MLKQEEKQLSFYSGLYEKIPETHLMKRISKAVDFSFINELVEDSYCKNFGRPAKEPEMMAKLLFLEYLYNLSDVRVIEEATYNLVFLWFLGLNPDDKLPNASLLAKFRTLRLKECTLDEILGEIVRQCVETGIIKSKEVSIDATHVGANCVKLIPERIMKHLAIRIFKALKKDLGEIPETMDMNIPDYKSIEDHKNAKATMKAYLEKVIDEAAVYAGENTKAAIEEAMELVHVTEIRHQDFTKISDGQRQRVMLARAICQEPEIIILDEPTSFLDVKYKLEFLSVLQELRVRKGLTVIMSIHELELAERVSDRILCVNGAYADRLGKPEEIFQAGYIKSLFGIETGSFDEENGSMELEPAKGKADIFVIAGGGSGRSIYRKLQRERRAFITGVIYENDQDFPVARALATELIAAKAFEPVDKFTIEQAKKAIDSCRKVICCRKEFGSLETANKELLEYAKQNGKEVEITERLG